MTSEDANFIPSPLRGATSYRLNTADGYELLYRRLTNQPRTRKPELGKLQTLAPRDRKQFFLPEDRQSSLKGEFLNASKGLLNWKKTLGNNQQITRPELKQLTDRIETEISSTTIVLGSPGCGKSALMATLGHWAVNENYVLLAIKADYLGNTVNTLEDLQQDIHLSLNIRDAIRAIASTDKVILLIDQLDGVAEMLDRKPERLNILLSLIQSLTDTKNVHIVATCREFEFRHGTQFARLESFERLDLQLPAWEHIAPLLEIEQHTPTAMGEALQELLRTPLHLDIFLKVAKSGEVFESLSKLLDHLWKVRILEKPEAQQAIACLTQLVKRMTTDEVSWVPSAIADENPKIYHALEQAGILMTNSDNLTLGFCHQTFYDHTLARAFARDSKSLIDFVLDGQDGIFIRPMLLRSLNYLRGTDPSNYQRHLNTLLTSTDRPIRSHIRTLLIEFVCAQIKPDNTEARLLIPLLNSETEGIKVLDAMIGSPGWFIRLHNRPEFIQWLEKAPEQAVYCCHLLRTAASFAADDVWGLLEEYWLHEQTYDLLSIQAIWNIGQWTYERVDLIRQVIQRSNIDWHTVAAIAERISENFPDAPAKMIRAHLDQQLEKAIAEIQVSPPELSLDAEEMQRHIHWYEYELKNPLRNLLQNEGDLHEIEKFARMNPKAFLDSIWSWFINILNQLARESDLNYTSYREDHLISLDRNHSKIIEALLAAISELAQQDGQLFLEFVTQNLQSDLLLVHRLMARGMEKIANQEPQFVLNYLVSDQRRLYLGDSLEGHQGQTKRLISAVCQHLSPEKRVRIEHVIRQFNYFCSWKEYEPNQRFLFFKYNRQNRLQLLLAFPNECLSPAGKRLKDEEIRAFPWEADEHQNSSIVKKSFDIKDNTSGPRINKDEMARTKDIDLLKLFNELSDETGWEYLRSQQNLSRSGGVIQQSREFGELVKDDPDRFLRLLPQLQPHRHENYVGKALLSLLETNVPSQELLKLVEELNQRGFSSEDFRDNVASMLEKFAEDNQGLPPLFLDLLESWLLTHSKPELEHYQSQVDSHLNLNSPIVFGLGGSHILPGGRGNIVRALADGYLKQQPPDLINWAKFIRSQLGIEPHPAVWVDILTNMPPLLDGNPSEATELFDQVIRSCPEVLQYSWALYFISRTIGWFEPKETMQNWLEILKADGSNFSHQAYGELLLIQYFQYQDEWSVQQILSHLSTQDSEAILCGLAHAASHLWGKRKCRAIATKVLYTLTSYNSDATQKIVASVFRLNCEHFKLDPGMRKLIQEICKNQGVLIAGARDLIEMIEFERLIDHDPDLVVEVCQSLIGLGVELMNPAESISLISDSLTTISIQLHRQPAYREVGLEIFEQLLALNLRETRSALETLDRKPNRSDPYLFPRKRRRSRNLYR